MQFYKIEGPVCRDTATYYLTSTDLSVADFKNVRRNAAAVITCAISDLMVDGFEGEFGCAGSEYASRVRAQGVDVQIDARIYGRCVEILEDGCQWVNSLMRIMREAKEVEVDMVKLALVARVIAVRHAKLLGDDGVRDALARLMVGAELGPLTKNDAVVPLSAPTWVPLKVDGKDCKYTRTEMGDYGSVNENTTVWVDGTDAACIPTVAALLKYQLSTVGVHRDARYATTHFNVYADLAKAQHGVCRNMATEVVTSERRYNTSCPIIYQVRTTGDVYAEVDDEVASVYFFRACDVLPRRLAELFTRRVEGGAKAQGFTLIGAYRHWVNTSKGTRFSADPAYCAKLGRELIRAAIGPYDTDEIGAFMKEKRIFLLKERFTRFEYQTADPGAEKTPPALDALEVPALADDATLEVPSSLVEPVPASTVDAISTVVDLTSEVKQMLGNVEKGRVDVVTFPSVTVTMDNGLLLMACGAVGCDVCQRVYQHVRRDPYAVAVTSAMLHSVVEYVTCPACRSARLLQEAVRFAYSRPE
jgi:hypothetical protein